MAALRNIGDEDPAILLDWDIAALNYKMARVNAMDPLDQPDLPNWMMITEAGYPITTVGLKLK
jgi:hypothetical protein